MILVYILFVIAIGVICWKIIYDSLFKEDEDEFDEEAQKILEIYKKKSEGIYNGIKPWIDQLDEQFKKWEMNGK